MSRGFEERVRKLSLPWFVGNEEAVDHRFHSRCRGISLRVLLRAK